jgi:long-chain acyl-CoA synthetase
MNIADALLAVARYLPSQPAVTAGKQTVTYGGFADRILRIAGALRRERGLAAGERVVLCMENGGEFLEVLFACWAAGLTVVPANAKLHARELAHIAENCGARLLFTTPTLIGQLAPLADELEHLDDVICSEDEVYRALRAGDPIACQPQEPTDTAWIFYTSGTTGRPKGATLTHRNLLFMAHCYYADIGYLDETDTKLHAAPLSHGSGLYAIPHMLRGGHQVVLPSFDPGSLLDAVAHYPNVTMFGAPTMVTRLVTNPSIEHADTRNLKTLYYGGGPMYVADLQKALRLLGPKLFQLYGQGESPMTITGLSRRQHAECDHPRYLERLGSCGVARTGVAIKVVDDEDRELPTGEVGEIITKSGCVMAGYWGNEAATAETLRGGWLHTGDVGSIDADGFLTLRDRSKDLIISGGTNIYPREIEEVLLTHPAVVECSVVGQPHPDWGEEVVAFVVARSGQAVEPATLDRLCLDRIARFKRPKHYRFVDGLPKNNYGKVLKTELRKSLQGEPA